MTESLRHRIEDIEQHATCSSVWGRIALVPFQVGLCLFAIYSGVSGLLNFGASNILFQAALKGAELYNILFIAAGAATIAGIACSKPNIEAFGLCCIISSLLVRITAITATTGWSQVSHNLLAISIIFVLACMVRLGRVGGFTK